MLYEVITFNQLWFSTESHCFYGSSFLRRITSYNVCYTKLLRYKLASREMMPEPSSVKINDTLSVGGDRLVVMAGPCSVESEEQILETAHAVKAAGATVLRGGAFKPRTSPYSFQG